MNGFDNVMADACMMCGGNGCEYCINGFVMGVYDMSELVFTKTDMDGLYVVEEY